MRFETGSYIAYIDECGDDGLGERYRTPGERGGRSHWLTIAASVWRKARDMDALVWRDEIRSQLAEQRQRQPLHFRDMKHEQKVMASSVLATKPFKAICVMANKPVIPDGLYTERNTLYFYMTRYLIERLSWFCRDMRRSVPEGSGSVEIVFSRRGGMSYESFQDYLSGLRRNFDQDIRVNWPVIDIDAVRAEDHSTLAGLQIADAVASAMTAGLEPDFYGNCESRYSQILKNKLYNRSGNFLSYGVKLVPWADRIPLNEQQLSFVDHFKEG